MRFFGGLLAVIGLLAVVLHFLNMNFIFLTWINKWGSTIAWVIRGGIIVLGAVLYFTGKPSDRE